MILRKFSDDELADELRARGFVVLQRGEIREIEAQGSIDLFSIERARKHGDAARIREHRILDLAGVIAREIVRAEQFRVTETERSHDLCLDLSLRLAILTPAAAARVGSSENRPMGCRNRLRDEGKPYPKSGCAACGNGGLVGCPHRAERTR